MNNARTRTWSRCAAVSLAVALCWPAGLGAQGIEAADDEQATAENDATTEPVWLGVQIAAGESEALVSRVLEHSPGKRAGIESGDRLLEVDGRQVDDLDSVLRALEGHAPGDEVTVVLRREGKKKTIDVVLSAKPARTTLLRRQFVGETLPSFRLVSLDDESEQLAASNLTGKPTLIEFWATWCGPCRLTSKTLGTLKKDFGDRFRIVATSDEPADRLERYVSEHPRPYRVWRDPDGSFQNALLISSFPTIFVVDAKGEVVDVLFGTGNEKRLRKHLERMLE